MESQPKITFKERLIHLQLIISDKAGSVVNRLSARNKALLFGLLVFIAIGYCVYLLVERPGAPVSGTSRITIVHSKPFKSPPLDSNDLNQILGIRKHLDILGRTAAGRAEIEHIRLRRPDLLDSLTQIEKQYRSQIKNYRK